MIRKIDPNERRILKFPAVRPCETISPTVLVSSLITLSHNISNFHSKIFPTQKRIAREIIRQINILLIFFEEMQDNKLIFTHSLNLCLSELHFALQKIHFLLQDCSREGTSFFILMKSQFVTNQFKVLIRSVGTALDIVHLDGLNISIEVKELVELLAKQAQKTQLEPDPSDEWTMERINFIMRQFENRYEPERGSIKWVLNYLGIKSWVDCNKEVQFLEDVMINHVEDDEKEAVLVSNLLGFVCYCRGVLFDTLDTIDEDLIINQSEEKSAGELLSCLNPEDFRCPISLELMIDPVTISTGQTYDRVSIQKWLNSGHLLCPKTGEKLLSTELVPNSALKRLIHQFCAENGVTISKPGRKIKDLKAGFSPSAACKEAMKFLAQFLAGRLSYGTDEQKNKAAYEIRLLTKTSAFNRAVLIEVGNIAPLLDLLTSSDANTQENAIAALLKLAKHSKGQKSIIEEGGLMLIISVLRKGLRIESRQIAAATIFYLSSVEKYRKLIGSTREAIPGLVELIKDGTVSGKKNAMAAIFGLLLYHGNYETFLESSIVPALVNLISCIERSDLLADALAILATLAEKPDGSIAILQTLAFNLIVGLVKSSISRAGKECCVSILLSLCIHGGAQVIAALAKEPAIMPSLYSVITDGSSHTSKKARTLINMLHKFHESSSSSLSAASTIRKERFVHVL